MFQSTPIGPFSTTVEDIDLDGIPVSYTSGTARLLERTPERITADGLDVLGVGLLLEGEMQGTAAAREFEAASGEILLFDLSQPVTMTMSVGRSVQAALPRALAEAHLGPVRGLHGVVIPRGPAAAYQDHLLELRDALQKEDGDPAGRLAQTLVTLLAQALCSSGLGPQSTKAPQA